MDWLAALDGILQRVDEAIGVGCDSRTPRALLGQLWSGSKTRAADRYGTAAVVDPVTAKDRNQSFADHRLAAQVAKGVTGRLKRVRH